VSKPTGTCRATTTGSRRTGASLVVDVDIGVVVVVSVGQKKKKKVQDSLPPQRY
jgi:hypothetical protein